MGNQLITCGEVRRVFYDAVSRLHHALHLAALGALRESVRGK